MKAALIIVDVQKAYYKGFAKESIDRAVSYINEVIPYFRAKGLPIIWVQDIDEASGVIDGTEGFEFVDNLEKMKAGEHSIHKKYGNSFNKTGLLNILKVEEISKVIIAGYCAEYCVLSTYRGAQDLDLTPFLLQNGVASGKQKHLEFVQNISDLVSYKILKEILE